MLYLGATLIAIGVNIALLATMHFLVCERHNKWLMDRLCLVSKYDYDGLEGERVKVGIDLAAERCRHAVTIEAVRHLRSKVIDLELRLQNTTVTGKMMS